uniref:START domain-containing protein n=1 Tax=Acrobeloides nanus TaxID=290746 RepID=A0A914DRV8_9BILA
MLNDHGCQITYVTHSDPKGKLPLWLVNRITKTVAPKLSRKLHKVCLKYPHWKSEHAPHWKPWLFPEQQINFRRINISECQPRDYDQPIIDETKVSSKDFKGVLEGDDEDND